MQNTWLHIQTENFHLGCNRQFLELKVRIFYK